MGISIFSSNCLTWTLLSLSLYLPSSKLHQPREASFLLLLLAAAQVDGQHPLWKDFFSILLLPLPSTLTLIHLLFFLALLALFTPLGPISPSPPAMDFTPLVSSPLRMTSLLFLPFLVFHRPIPPLIPFSSPILHPTLLNLIS